ncbi:MAG: dihydrolipoamide acetyltransferase family protein [Pseudomonadales bacterium]
MSVVFELKIPVMGSVENAQFINWIVDEGATFAKGDPLYEIETDKTTAEIEADVDGILVRQSAVEGDEFKVGDCIGLHAAAGTSRDDIVQALAELAEEQATAEDISDADQGESGILPQPPSSVQSSSAAQSPAAEQAIKSSPHARKLAREHDIDLNVVTGTGPGGRITGENIQALLAAQSARDKPGADPRMGSVPVTRVHHSLRRKTIARNLSRVHREAPHLTADMDIDLSALYALREEIAANGETPPSILSFFAKTTAQLLLEYKRFNATFGDEEMLLWDTVNLGVGVDTEGGLVVPVIRDAQALSAVAISAAIAALAKKARDGTLDSSELEGSTFTISNPGSIGPVVRVEAILNGPQVALLGLSGILNKPTAIESPDGSYQVEVRPMLRAGLTFDHRAIDGGPVVRFLNELKERIEGISSE